MKKITLGADGPEVSQFGIGAMSFAGAYGAATAEDCHTVLDLCRTEGVTHIDTANLYGKGLSEKIIGDWFAANPGSRAEMTLATKAGNTGDPERRFNNDPDYLVNCLEESLTRLKTDYVDLFYIHRYDPMHSIEDVAGTLRRILDSGKAKAVGLSEVAPGTLRRAVAECPITAVQSEYSLSTRAPELGLRQACREVGAILVAFSPQGRSFLTDAPFSLERAQSHNFTKGNPRFQQPNYGLNISKTNEFRALAADMGLPAASLAIAWLISQGEDVLPIPGTRNVDHLRELLKGAKFGLSSQDLERIDAALPVGWAYGDRYSYTQWAGPERYS